MMEMSIRYGDVCTVCIGGLLKQALYIGYDGSEHLFLTKYANTYKTRELKTGTLCKSTGSILTDSEEKFAFGLIKRKNLEDLN